MLISLEGDGPLFQRIYEGFRAAILDGRLAPGARLPASRALAKELGVSRTTVMLAYDQLFGEGYVSGRAGSGTYVSSELPDPAMRAPAAEAHASESVSASVPLSAYGRRLVKRIDLPPPRAVGLAYDFRYGLPPVEELPHEAWRRARSRRTRSASIRSMQYGPPAGYEPLREAIAAYLGRSRAVVCDASRVVVVNGSQQAIDLVTRLLVDEGDTVIVEEPHYQGARTIFQAAGARLVAVPVDREGLDATAFPPEAKGARLAYVTPSHQFPSGAVMTLARRLALLGWAEERGTWVLEDDYDSEFRYTGRPVESLQGLDRSSRVIYAGTFSKVLFPSMRVGYLVLSPSLVEIFTKAKWLADRHTPTLEQETLADFIASGDFERHLRRSRIRNAARREALLEALAEAFGDRVEIEGEAAGIHVIVWLRDVAPEALDDVVRRAREASVGIYPVAPYFLTPPPRAGLLMGYASLDEREIRAGVERLARVLV